MNRRIFEARALRQFFQEQMAHIQTLLSERQQQQQAERESRNQSEKAVEHIVSGTDTRIRAIGGYRNTLRSYAGGLQQHLNGLVDRIPGALCIEPQSFAEDPTINALFVNKEEMLSLFEESDAIQHFFSRPEHRDLEQVFALLFLSRQEKQILGSEHRGDLILRDVPQTSVSFSGFQLSSPRPTENAARSALREMLFSSAVDHIKGEITRLRHQRSEEERRIARLNPQQNIDNPEVYLQKLTEQLSLPDKLVGLEQQMLRISRIGIRLPMDSNTPSNLLKLQEVRIGSQPSRVVTIIRYPRRLLGA